MLVFASNAARSWSRVSTGEGDGVISASTSIISSICQTKTKIVSLVRMLRWGLR